MATKTVIIGVGNLLRKDDGIGPAVIETLMGSRVRKNDKQDEITLLDGGTDGLALLDIIKQYQKAIIIDAVDMGQAPGTVRAFTPQEAKINIKSDALTTHSFGLAELLSLCEQLEIKTKIQIIGIQPQDISFGEGLSPIIEQQIPAIIRRIYA